MSKGVNTARKGAGAMTAMENTSGRDENVETLQVSQSGMRVGTRQKHSARGAV